MSGRDQAALDALDGVRRGVLAALGGAGAVRVQPSLLQPAGELLAGYGEALRGRACVVADAHGGELYLLPDYTVPICRMRREAGGGGRFLYAGPVFRLPAAGGGSLPVEEQQAGLEVFTTEASAEADADVLCRTLEAARLAGRKLEVTLGDAGIGPAILDAFEMSERRRARLRRRISQPQRLHALLRRFTRGGAGGGRRAGLEPFADAGRAEARLAETLARAGTPFIGRRRPAEVAARLGELAAEHGEAPLAEATASRIASLLATHGPFRPALAGLGDAIAGAPAAEAAIGRLQERARRLSRVVDMDELGFDIRLGGEVGYYDGMVFEIRIAGRRVAAGGRYDRLARDTGLDLAAVGAAVWIERLLGAGSGAG